MNKLISIFALFFVIACSEDNAGENENKIEIGGDYTLTNQNGEVVTNANYADKPKLIFFGFTNCPVVCPTSMATITAALYDLEDDANAVYPIFISVDNERDNPEQLTKFLKDFHPNFIGLTGNDEQIEKVKQDFRVFAKKAKIPLDGNYDMQHSTIIYLLDKNGDYIGHFNHQSSSEEIAEAVKSKI